MLMLTPTDIGGISKSLLTYMTLQGILMVIYGW